MNIPTKKYRPYFTLPELETLAGFCASNHSTHPALYRYISDYISDIHEGLRKENHITKPRASIEQRLGLVSSTDEDAYRYSNDLMTAQEEIAYEIRVGIRIK